MRKGVVISVMSKSVDGVALHEFAEVIEPEIWDLIRGSENILQSDRRACRWVRTNATPLSRVAISIGRNRETSGSL
jgi:hypothetical protein